jgi:hypothetical protein
MMDYEIFAILNQLLTVNDRSACSSFNRTLRQTYFFSLPSSLLHPLSENHTVGEDWKS